MSVFQGLIMGIIQGLTEFLPISSSGHLSLYQYFAGISGDNSLFFTLMLHLGTLAAVIAAYYEDLWAMLKDVGLIIKEIFGRRFTTKAETPQRKLLFMLFFACLPMVAVLPFHGLISRVSGDNDIIVEGVCFLITSALLFAACKVRRGKAGVMKMKPRHALTIGVAQGIATFPGISRSGSTIATGLILGFDRAFMVKFSFLLGIPAILGGVVVEIGDVNAADMAKVGMLPLVVGMLAAAVVGYICIRLVRWLVVTDKFVAFAWYTLVLGVLVVILGIMGHILGWGQNPTDVAAAAAGLVTVRI